MTAVYKIFYTNRTTLLWSDVSANGDPNLIPAAKRIGIHSIIQPMDNNTMRETIEQYHYYFSIRDNQWVGLGLDGLLDYLVNDFEDIRCVMHGRTMATDKFWEVKQTARTDTDIIGGITLADAEMSAYYHLEKYRTPYYQSAFRGAYFDPNSEYWSENARHRQYMEGKSEEPIYGYQEYYH